MTLGFTPIGVLPDTYPHFDLLCKKAHMRYRKEKDSLLVTWSIVVSEKINQQGKSVTTAENHNNFCVLLDYVDLIGRKAMERSGVKGTIKTVDKVNVALGVVDHLVLPDGGSLTIDQKKIQSMKIEDMITILRGANETKYNTISSQSSPDRMKRKEDWDDKNEGWSKVGAF